MRLMEVPIDYEEWILVANAVTDDPFVNFLEVNGYDVELPDDTWFAHFLVMAITGEFPPEILEDELRRYVVPAPD